MRIEDISESDAWAIVRGALLVEWPASGAVRLCQSGFAIEITQDGEWFSEAGCHGKGADLLDIFLPLIAGRRTFAIAQLGQSLDGRIATNSGHSHYINGLSALTHLHRLRAIVDAVVVGVGTVNADNPQLTVRHVEGAHPVRVVLDPTNRVDPLARLLHDGLSPVLHLVSNLHAFFGSETLPGVTRLVVETDAGGGFSPSTVLKVLAARGLRRVLIEGGGITVSKFLEARVLDRLHISVAPMLIGSGRPGLSLAPIDTLDDALRPSSRVFDCGGDMLFDLAFVAHGQDLLPQACGVSEAPM